MRWLAILSLLCLILVIKASPISSDSRNNRSRPSDNGYAKNNNNIINHNIQSDESDTIIHLAPGHEQTLQVSYESEENINLENYDPNTDFDYIEFPEIYLEDEPSDYEYEDDTDLIDNWEDWDEELNMFFDEDDTDLIDNWEDWDEDLHILFDEDDTDLKDLLEDWDEDLNILFDEDDTDLIDPWEDWDEDLNILFDEDDTDLIDPWEDWDEELNIFFDEDDTDLIDPWEDWDEELNIFFDEDDTDLIDPWEDWDEELNIFFDDIINIEENLVDNTDSKNDKGNLEADDIKNYITTTRYEFSTQNLSNNNSKDSMNQSSSTTTTTYPLLNVTLPQSTTTIPSQNIGTGTPKQDKKPFKNESNIDVGKQNDTAHHRKASKNQIKVYNGDFSEDPNDAAKEEYI